MSNNPFIKYRQNQKKTQLLQNITKSWTFQSMCCLFSRDVPT